ncbi:hypothetical protein JKP88DRAFT_214451 [Tribonema minus]|uniref:Uncharacterized protein n=1 Tax=Tribonema minus TaxID=303371 RepID=A0A835ZQD6_9STRA|nr:hypothetical protein JKP88DRAFT_214451 [Tribonema minus]
MKTIAIAAAACAAASVEGFVLAPAGTQCSSVVMSAEPLDRRAFAGNAAVALAGLTAFSQGASAAKYFGDKNDYPEVVKPEDAVKDDAAFGSAETKSAVSDIKGYKQAVVELQSALKADPQADLRSQLKRSFEYSKLRTSLNTAGAAFDEDSQRGLDRITRLILQDAVEFEEASKLKPGTTRNQRKLSLMTTKLTKLSSELDEMLKFF